MISLRPLICIGLICMGDAAWAAEKRSAAVLREFQRLNPCPSTGLRSDPCPQYVRDHIVPVCLGHEFDRVDNLQWSTHDDSLRKDRVEREVCAFDRWFNRDKSTK